jgi:hypothetical protein
MPSQLSGSQAHSREAIGQPQVILQLVRQVMLPRLCSDCQPIDPGAVKLHDVPQGQQLTEREPSDRVVEIQHCGV